MANKYRMIVCEVSGKSNLLTIYNVLPLENIERERARETHLTQNINIFYLRPLLESSSSSLI